MDASKNRRTEQQKQQKQNNADIALYFVTSVSVLPQADVSAPPLCMRVCCLLCVWAVRGLRIQQVCMEKWWNWNVVVEIEV